MFSTLRTRFGIPGVISVIALIFAMLGGAYAASSNSGGKATASAKAKRGPKGPKGATGPAGPAGPQGPAGPAGAKGDAGANGSNGAVGPTGPTGAAGAKGATGATGPTGPTGLSGFTKELPSGKTETGTWNVSQNVGIRGAVGTYVYTSISFPIPLAEGGEAFGFAAAETKNEEFGSSGCSGTVEYPTAPAGKLCVYTSHEEVNNGFGFREVQSPVNNSLSGQFAPTGALLLTAVLEGGPEPKENAGVEAWGTWAVTAP